MGGIDYGLWGSKETGTVWIGYGTDHRGGSNLCHQSDPGCAEAG